MAWNWVYPDGIFRRDPFPRYDGRQPAADLGATQQAFQPDAFQLDTFQTGISAPPPARWATLLAATALLTFGVLEAAAWPAPQPRKIAPLVGAVVADNPPIKTVQRDQRPDWELVWPMPRRAGVAAVAGPPPDNPPPWAQNRQAAYQWHYREWRLEYLRQAGPAFVPPAVPDNPPPKASRVDRVWEQWWFPQYTAVVDVLLPTMPNTVDNPPVRSPVRDVRGDYALPLPGPARTPIAAVVPPAVTPDNPPVRSATPDPRRPWEQFWTGTRGAAPVAAILPPVVTPDNPPPSSRRAEAAFQTHYREWRLEYLRQAGPAFVAPAAPDNPPPKPTRTDRTWEQWWFLEYTAVVDTTLPVVPLPDSPTKPAPGVDPRRPWEEFWTGRPSTAPVAPLIPVAPAPDNPPVKTFVSPVPWWLSWEVTWAAVRPFASAPLLPEAVVPPAGLEDRGGGGRWPMLHPVTESVFRLEKKAAEEAAKAVVAAAAKVVEEAPKAAPAEEIPAPLARPLPRTVPAIEPVPQAPPSSTVPTLAQDLEGIAAREAAAKAEQMAQLAAALDQWRQQGLALEAAAQAQEQAEEEFLLLWIITHDDQGA